MLGLPSAGGVVVAGTCFFLLGVGPARGGAQETPAQDVAALEATVAALERRVELASGDSFYLILDPGTSDLTLMLGGATLLELPVSTFRLGLPKRSFGHDQALPAWRDIIWRNGKLAPPRPVEERTLELSPAGDEQLPEVPQTAEVAIQVPERYRIKFADGLTLEIVRRAPERGDLARLRGWMRRSWEDFETVGTADGDALRVELTMDRDAADVLYRSLPPQVSLSVEPLVGRTITGPSDERNRPHDAP